jgi:HlyD family secretion protein
MSTDGSPRTGTQQPPHIEVHRPRPRRRKGPWVPLAALAAVVAGLWALGYRPDQLWNRKGPPLLTVEVDRGDVPAFVVEGGTLESANNATVKCQVEALIGLVGGAVNGQNAAGGANRQGAAGTANRAGGAPGTGGSTVAGANANAGQQQATTTPNATDQQAANQAAAAPKKARYGAARKSNAQRKVTSPTGLMGAQATADAANGAAGGAGGQAGGGGAAGGAGTTTTAANAATAGFSDSIPMPAFKSFTMEVPPHTPLRPATTQQATAAAAKPPQQTLQQQQQGGGRNNNPFGQEQPGSTRILSILPEGTRVKQGDVVCELDSAAFRDELLAQLIRWDQAKSWVEQARSALRVAEISLKEYREGLLPQDRHLMEGYILQLRNDLAQKRLAYDADKELDRKKIPNQLKASTLALEKAEISVNKALEMQQRLERFTAPRLIKNLEAKIAAVKADLLAQEAAFGLEDERKRRLERNIEACTMRAPRDGIVVYAAPANRWGRVEAMIQEGVTVREGQDIFKLPDPRHMRVRANINESRVAMVYSGQAAEIRIDAFPELALTGKVAEVTPIPAPAAGPISDVKLYYAMVDIDDSYEALRPGLSAEVSFAQDTRRGVTRVPVKAIRWLDDAPYVALPTGDGYAWRRLELGLFNATHAEVRSGLKPGDRVVADPESLPPPGPTPPSHDASAVARSAGKRRG